MSEYLYGASVQGIQEFIFKTNKLKEVIGASEVIKSIDKIDFKKDYKLNEEPKIILHAAGNVRLIFDNLEDLEQVVKNFPKDMMLKAYGITISQAVVEHINDYKTDSRELEKRLKIQRNKVSLPLDFHFNILKQNSRTAIPAIKKDKDEYLDKATSQKIEACPKTDENKELKDIANKKNKIAIIHADGNGLGNIVKDLTKEDIIKFSKNLGAATKEAYNIASEGIREIRKVILGGDDLTIICNANDALTFTKRFLEAFEEQTKDIYNKKSLTACAGISYCNEKYPFYYAKDLAEKLCTFAKKDSKKINKELPPSSLMFHNIQSSNVESFKKFILDELTIKYKITKEEQNLSKEILEEKLKKDFEKNFKKDFEKDFEDEFKDEFKDTFEKLDYLLKKRNIQCDFGPYYLKEQNSKPMIEIFENILKDFRKKDAPKGRLREWLNDLSFDRDYAKNQLERINEISSTKWKSEYLEKLYPELSLNTLIVKKDKVLKTPIYDILQILSVEDEKNDI